MQKIEIVKEVAKKTGLDKTAVSVVIDEALTSIREANIRGEEVYIRGFGTFGIAKRAAKKGRIIKKGITIDIPAHNIPKFKPCKEYKADVISHCK